MRSKREVKLNLDLKPSINIKLVARGMRKAHASSK